MTYEEFICEKFHAAWNPARPREEIENKVIEEVINYLDWEALPPDIMVRVCPSYISEVVRKLIDFENLRAEAGGIC